MLKKYFAFIISALVMLAAAGINAEPKIEVSLRFSEHDGFSRVVFEAGEESFINNANITATPTQIKIQFPSVFILNTQSKHGLDITQQGRIITINPANPSKIKVLRLSSPPRLAIDILAETTEIKPRPQESGSSEIMPNHRVVIDPGHGGYDSGMLSGDLKEKDIVLSIARAMESIFIKKNKPVYLTRKADQSMSIADRALFANQKAPDVFISIHLSSGNSFVIYSPFIEHSGSDIPVSEIYDLMHRQRRYAEKSRALAEGIGKAIKDEFNVDVTFREMALPLLNSVGSAAIMIEVPRAVAGDDAMKSGLPNALLKGIGLYANK